MMNDLYITKIWLYTSKLYQFFNKIDSFSLCLSLSFIQYHIKSINWFSFFIIILVFERYILRKFMNYGPKTLINYTSQNLKNYVSTCFFQDEFLCGSKPNPNNQKLKRYSLCFYIMIIIFCLIIRYSHIVFELKPRIPCDNIFNKMVPCMELQSSEVSINGLCCENENTSQGRSYDQIDIDLYDCSFSRFSHFQGYGGVIFINDGTFYMSIYKTIFFNCLSDYGGAIFFSSSNSVMRMICEKMCSASY